MNLRLNRTLFQQTDADSAALTMITTVVHRPRDTGEQMGTIYRGEQAVGEFALSVLEEESPLAVQIDLAGQHLSGEARTRAVGKLPGKDDCCDDQEMGTPSVPTYAVGRGGYVVFHVSGGAGGYWVQLAQARQAIDAVRSREEAQKLTWNSRDLQDGDLFAVTLLRPGAYRVMSQSGGEGAIKLGYPERGRVAYRPPEALRVTATADGVDPRGIELQPLQGLVFEIKGAPRITIRLTEPEDRPEPERSDRPERSTRLRYSLVRRHGTSETPQG